MLQRLLRQLFLWVLGFGALAPLHAPAAPVLITVQTPGLVGTAAQIAFDLIDGGAPGNSVSITSFMTTGALGQATLTGGASGSLATGATLTDSSFFNEFLQSLVLGNMFSFVYDSTGRPPTGGALPDGFSLYLLAANGAPLVTTNDPTGANALLLDNIGAALGLQVYQAAGVTITATPVGVVSEPASLMLVALALLGVLWPTLRRLGSAWAAAMAAVLGLAALAGPAAAADVSDRISVTPSAFVLNRATNTFDSTVSLRNTSAVGVTAPITLEVSSISAPSVNLANSAGLNENGRPFVNVPGGLAPGAQTSVVLKFANPQRVTFGITTRVFGTLPSIDALPEFVAAPRQFFVNTPTQVRFQAQIPPSPALNTGSVRLFRATDAGQPTGNALCSLLDNGALANGDDIAGDNVYSCFSTFSSPTPVAIRLVVSASVGAGTALSPVIVINVVGTLDASAAQIIVAAQAQARQLAQQAIAQLGDNLAARQAAVASIRGVNGVQAAGVSSDNTSIWIRYASGVDGGLMLNPPGTRGSAARKDKGPARPSFDSPVPASLAAAPASFPHWRPRAGRQPAPAWLTGRSQAAAVAENTNIGNTNVIIWDAYNSDFMPFDEGPDLRARFSNAQCPLYNVTYLKDDQATVASVRTFTNFGTVVLVTHGAVDGNGDVVFLTRETAGVTAILANAIELLLGRIMIMGDVFAIRPSFIANLPGAMPDAVVYNGSCQSSANATMANAFTGKGAKTYYGYTRVVNSDFAQSTANQLFTSLATNLRTTGEAFTAVTPKVDPTSPFATFTQAGDVNLAYTGDLQNGNFERGNLGAWTRTGDGRVVTGLGAFAPTDGSYAGLVSTGLGFTTSSGTIEQNFCLPATATQIKFDWNFSSEEFIEYCGSSFDDKFEVVLETSTGAQTLFQRSVNGLCTTGVAPTALFFDQSGPGCSPSVGVGYGTGGQDCRVYSTGWNSATINISGVAASNAGRGVKLRFRATDVGDSIFDSAILIDKITVVRP